MLTLMHVIKEILFKAHTPLHNILINQFISIALKMFFEGRARNMTIVI